MNLDLRLPVGVLFIMLAMLLIGYSLLGPRQAAVIDFGVSINLIWGAVMACFGLAMSIGALAARRKQGR